MKLSPKRALAALAGIGVLGALAGAALAGPPSGQIVDLLLNRANFDQAIHVNGDRIKFHTKDATDVRFVKATYPPGSNSGWHFHPGVVIAAVKSGTIASYDANCTRREYGPTSPNGAVFLEYADVPAWKLANEGTETVEIYAAFVVPDGSAFSDATIPDPACAST